MVKGQIREESLSKEEILHRISAYDVYRHFLGDFTIGKAFCNPARGEQNPSMIIRPYNGTLYHRDYGDLYYRGDCINLVQQLYSCSFSDALKRIVKEFSLEERKKPTIPWKQPKIDIYSPPLIWVVTRKPNVDEIQFWNKRGIDISDVKKEEVYFPKEVWVNRVRSHFWDNELTFAYWYEKTKSWKLYCPNNPHIVVHNKEISRKFFTNTPFDHIEGLENVESPITLLGKARKDVIILKKATGISSVVEMQAEDPACLNDDTLIYLKERGGTIYSCLDNDKKGVETSWWLTNNHGFKHANVPYNLKKNKGEGTIKDFDELAVNKGLDAVTQQFVKKGII